MYAEEFERMEDSKKRIDFKDSARAIILDNPYARVAFPSTVLGPLDQRWGMGGSSGWYTMVSMGEDLARLRRMDRPVPFLAL